MSVNGWVTAISLFLVAACAAPDTLSVQTIPTSTTAPVAPATVPTTAAATTTTGHPVWTIHSREATEGFGVYDGRAAAQTKLFDLDGRLVAEYPGDLYLGDAGRVYYWFLESPGLWRENDPNFIPGVGCQPPFPGFDPAGPFLAVCGDPPQSIVMVDPVTGEILEQLSGPTALDDPIWRVRWATTGPEGEVIAQVGFECEVPVVHVLENGVLRPMLPSDEGNNFNSIHMGWTSEGDALIQLLGSACGFGPRPGVARLTDDSALIQLWEGEGAAFRWQSALPATHPNDNVRERRLFAALASLGLEGCCGEPAHGSPNASTGMTWEGVDYYIGAADLATTEPISDPIRRYKVDRVDVLVATNEPVERHVFACGDTVYSVANWLDGTTVPEAAIEALIGALGCNG
ncbi:MAG TPA: hypothetical protein VM848_12650 [Acidimicrobiia bacterium]|nr:hypothetical protein [Acidimicrobiia bacterium]